MALQSDNDEIGAHHQIRPPGAATLERRQQFG
jgi:hypothetical protein